MSELEISTTGQTDFTYSITIDPTPQHTKPSKTDASFGKISNSLTLVTGLTINEFSTYVSQPYGYTWSGGLFNGHINNVNWYQQSVFALDFDKGNLSIDEVLDRFKERDIIPQLWYNTFSDTDTLKRFRVVLFVDTPVEQLEQRNLIANGLLNLFPEADENCKDLARYYLGGKQSQILHNNSISLRTLLDILSIEIITKDGGRARKIPSNLLEMNSGQKQPFLYNNNRSNHFLPISSSTTTIEGNETETIDFEVARQKIKILDSFLNGEWLHHIPLFGLATNMINIKGGRKLMKETMKKYNELGSTKYTKNNFSIFTYLNKVNYPAIPIYKFSHYSEDYDHHDIITATKDVRGYIERIKPIVKMSLNAAEMTLEQKFEEVMSDNDLDKIHLFTLPTAIGKTQSIVSTTATIAAPTNTLKREIAGRMKVEWVATPDKIIFENEQLNQRVQYYYSIGLPKKAVTVISDVADGKNCFGCSHSDIMVAENYMGQLNESKSSEKTILTTHTRALYTEPNHDIIIFDEDPLNSLIDIKKVLLSDIQELDNQIMSADQGLVDTINFLKSAIPGEIIPSPASYVDIDKLTDKVKFSNIIKTNIFNFFDSSYFIKDIKNSNLIYYVVKQQLPKNKKVIILSATIPLYIYQKLYGDKLDVVKITDVEQKGKIIQHTKRSCSRNALNRYCPEMSKEVGNKPVITFKQFSSKFENPVKNMHFGNCSGSDTMKGQDLVVVGTPHRNNIEYFLTAKVMGIDFKTTDTAMHYQKIEYNGFRFKFNCFDNEELRLIQLALIESDLIQAVGRARTLRTNATVDVYSNLPLRISDEFIY